MSRKENPMHTPPSIVERLRMLEEAARLYLMASMLRMKGLDDEADELIEEADEILEARDEN
jgi:hypothetical protein